MFLKLALLAGCLYAAIVPAQAAQPVLILGDSLSAAYGIDQRQGWVELLRRRMQDMGYTQAVVNLSISGETTSGGRARIDDALRRYRPDIVILELGANDGLRGLGIDEMRSNLSAIIERCRAAHARIVLVGMRLPPNYGPQYSRRFAALFGELAQRYALALVPFLLEGVAQDRTRMQGDGLHPKAEAQMDLLDNVWPALSQLLRTGHPSRAQRN